MKSTVGTLRFGLKESLGKILIIRIQRVVESDPCN